MQQSDPDVRIDAWLREQLDAVPEPARAVAEALDAAASTPQRHGRLFWLRQLLGLDRSRIQRGDAERPEVVLMPGLPAGSAGTRALGREGAIPLPLMLLALAVALAIVGALAWMTVGPGRELIGGSTRVGTVAPEQPLRPLDPPGPDRVIAVDPENGHFATLDGAIAAAEPGDRIELYPGTYQAEVTITDDVTIVGVGDREDIIVEPLPLAEGEDVRDRVRRVFTLRDSDATLQGFTVRSSLNGTTIVVDGGSPQLLDLYVDPVGDGTMGSPTSPREAFELGGGTTATVRDSLITSLGSVFGGATPVFERVTFDGGCLFIEDGGTDPIVRDTTFRDSRCPGFSISAAKGASATLEANHIYSRPDQAGIRAANSSTSVAVRGTDITGGREGILATDGAEIDVMTTQVDEAQVGVRVIDADAILRLNRLERNVTGLQVSGDGYLETISNDICDNELNLDLADGALVPLAQNAVRADCRTGSATEDGT